MFLVERPDGKRPSENLGVGGWIILKPEFKVIGFGSVDWIHLALNRDGAGLFRTR